MHTTELMAGSATTRYSFGCHERAPHRVVVIGGGFAGLHAALKLARHPVEVTLVDRRNFHLFQPLAYQVATGALSPGEICFPLRVVFRKHRNVRVLLAEVTGFDLASRRVELRAADLRRVGGGTTGVEMAGQIAEIVRDTRREFHIADSAAARVLLVEAGERILSGFPKSLSERAARALERLGVTPLLEHTVTDIEDGAVTITTPEGGLERRAARTVIWAAGVTPSSLAGALARASGGEIDRAGRLVVEADLTVAGHPEVLALGDMVAIRRGDRVEALPGIAPVAMQQGRHAARVVLGNLQGRHASSFRYHDKGNLATIGRARAVADLRVIRLSGAPAWITWLGVHLYYLIGVQNRLLVLTRWAFSVLTRGRGARLISGPAAEPVAVEAMRPAA